MTEKELEKLFKTKLGSASYDYNPAAWTAMENLLDQKATRGGAYFWRSAAAILLFGVLAASVTFWQTGQQLPETPSAVSVPLTEPALPQQDKISQEPQADPVISSSMAGTDIQVSNPVADLEEDEGASDDAPESFAVNTPDPSAGDSGMPPESSATSSPGIISNEDGILAIREQEEESTLEGLDAKVPSFSAVTDNGNIRPNAFKLTADKTGTRQGLFLKGGTILNESYNTGDVGVGFHLGFEYQVGIARNLEFSAGLTYSRINKLGIHQEFDSTFYHFSSERIETEITASQLNYLEMPVSFNWRFHPRHQIGLGAYAALLISVSEDVEKRHYRQGNEMAVSRTVDEGKLSPYEDYDLGLGCNYFFMIDHQLELGLEFRYGLMDITRDLEGVYERNHQNLNTRISLRYRII